MDLSEDKREELERVGPTAGYAGYKPLDEIRAALLELVEYDPETEAAVAADRGAAVRAVDEIVTRHADAHARKQQEFPAETDPERLSELFRQLESSGIVARENVGYTQSDLSSEMWDLLDERDERRGFVAFHGQDLERVIDDGVLHFVLRAPIRPGRGLRDHRPRSRGQSAGGRVRRRLERRARAPHRTAQDPLAASAQVNPAAAAVALKLAERRQWNDVGSGRMASTPTPSATELLKTIRDGLAPSPGVQILYSAFWDEADAGRFEVLLNMSRDALTAAEVAAGPAAGDRRAGHELALWLRKSVELLATVINFAVHDNGGHYALWTQLTMHWRQQKTLKRVAQTVTAAPTAAELAWAFPRAQTTAKIAQSVAALVAGGAPCPWYVGASLWTAMCAGGPGAEEAIRKWSPPAAVRTLELARTHASDREKILLGQYDLTYGQYSGQVHAGAPGSTEQWETMDRPGLELAALLVAARLVSLTTTVPGLAARIEQVVASLPHGMSVEVPAPGDGVDVLKTSSATVAEVSSDLAVARVHDAAAGTTELRPILHLRPH